MRIPAALRLSQLVLSVALALALASGLACGDHGADAPPCDASRALSMTVSHGAESDTVDLGTLSGTEEGDLCLVPLLDVVNAAGLSLDPEGSYYDFVAGDGFRPTQVGCVTVDTTTLEGGWVDRVTGTLVWDETLGLRGCYSVTGAVEIAVYDDPWAEEE